MIGSAYSFSDVVFKMHLFLFRQGNGVSSSRQGLAALFVSTTRNYSSGENKRLMLESQLREYLEMWGIPQGGGTHSFECYEIVKLVGWLHMLNDELSPKSLQERGQMKSLQERGQNQMKSLQERGQCQMKSLQERGQSQMKSLQERGQSQIKSLPKRAQSQLKSF